MNTMKWLKLNLFIAFLLFVLPWVFVACMLLQNAFWRHFDRPITSILSTPSGAKFWSQDPNRAYEGLCPANVSSYGYQVDNYGRTAASNRQDNVTITRMYVEKPSSFRIVKSGVIGRSISGYYVIDTNQRRVSIYSDRQTWKRKLAQMGISSDIKFHPFPLRRSYIQRGWLSFSAE